MLVLHSNKICNHNMEIIIECGLRKERVGKSIGNEHVPNVCNQILNWKFQFRYSITIKTVSKTGYEINQKLLRTSKTSYTLRQLKSREVGEEAFFRETYILSTIV